MLLLFQIALSTNLLFANDSISIQPNTNIHLTPMYFDSSRLGSLLLDLYPNNADLFINGQKIAYNSNTAMQLFPGIYHIQAFSGKKSTEKHVIILPDQVNYCKFYVKSPLRFYVEPAFSYFIAKGYSCFGPAFEIGFKFKNISYGLNYLWDLGYTKYSVDALGGGLIYSYEFIYKRFLSLSPTASIGYWVIDGSHVWEHFWGGPGLKLCAGLNHFDYTANYNLLFGTNIGHNISFSIKITF
jgi:hypothetical protein